MLLEKGNVAHAAGAALQSGKQHDFHTFGEHMKSNHLHCYK